MRRCSWGILRYTPRCISRLSALGLQSTALKLRWTALTNSAPTSSFLRWRRRLHKSGGGDRWLTSKEIRCPLASSKYSYFRGTDVTPTWGQQIWNWSTPPTIRTLYCALRCNCTLMCLSQKRGECILVHYGGKCLSSFSFGDYFDPLRISLQDSQSSLMSDYTARICENTAPNGISH